MQRKLAELGLFFREFRRSYHSTGSIAPSSRFLANALSRYVASDSEKPRRILEVGPGTGAVTRQIIRGMGPHDQFDLVELNDAFVNLLRGRFENEAAFQAVRERSRVLHQRVEDLPRRPAYDVIVSGLPLNNFSSDDVARILETFDAVAKPGGMLSFFEYIAVRSLRSILSGSAQRRRLRSIGQLLHSLLAEKEIRRDCVWINFPPAWVHHVHIGQR